MPYKGFLERRYAFRFLKIERLDTAPFPIGFTDIYLDSTSAVELSSAPALNSGDELYDKIYNISLNTLKECEQDVFEDGPKRDRRLWIGDLRLEALANYYTFGDTALVKRCLYLRNDFTASFYLFLIVTADSDFHCIRHILGVVKPVVRALRITDTRLISAKVVTKVHHCGRERQSKHAEHKHEEQNNC